MDWVNVAAAVLLIVGMAGYIFCLVAARRAMKRGDAAETAYYMGWAVLMLLILKR